MKRPSKVPEKPPERDHRMDFQQVASQLENKILIGAFKPRERLVEKNLSQMFQVSRFVIRDVLKILETKGLVRLIPYRGAVVSDIDLQELEEIYVIRIALEKLATRLAVQNIRPSDIKVLKRMAKKVRNGYLNRDFHDMLATNESFHDYIFKISRNQTLQKMINELRARCHIVRHSAWSSQEFAEQSVKEHQLYIEALEKKDADQLEELAERHIVRAKRDYVAKSSRSDP